jgi:hypothetical protein
MAQPIARSSASTLEGKRRSAWRRSASSGPERSRRGRTRRLKSTRTVPFPANPLEMLVEMRAIACDDDELLKYFR